MSPGAALGLATERHDGDRHRIAHALGDVEAQLRTGGRRPAEQACEQQRAGAASRRELAATVCALHSWRALLRGLKTMTQPTFERARVARRGQRRRTIHGIGDRLAHGLVTVTVADLTSITVPPGACVTCSVHSRPGCADGGRFQLRSMVCISTADTRRRRPIAQLRLALFLRRQGAAQLGLACLLLCAAAVAACSPLHAAACDVPRPRAVLRRASSLRSLASAASSSAALRAAAAAACACRTWSASCSRLLAFELPPAPAARSLSRAACLSASRRADLVRRSAAADREWLAPARVSR